VHISLANTGVTERGRFVSRLVPISAVGGATLKQISETARTLIVDGFGTPDNRSLKVSPCPCVAAICADTMQFAIAPHSRNSNKVDRMEMIKKIADEVVALPAGHKVDLSNAERTILVEVDRVCA
jgi:tRNA acetyltransferase TAN1